MTDRPDYDAGDLVVFIMEHSNHPVIQPGKVFRVIGLFQASLRGQWVWGVSLDNVQTRQPHQIGFPAHYFRRIDRSRG